MKVPDNCPHCKVEMGTPDAYWIERTDIDYDSDNEDRIEDQIWECSVCQTLFRLKWKLVAFIELVEKAA